jgi:hypothetical protein
MTLRLPARSLPQRQRGVVLFVALIAMLLLSLAGIALVRSVDTSLGVAGNLGFRHASVAPVNRAIEEAIQDVFKAVPPVIQINDDMLRNYFATLQPGESKTGVPALLQGDYTTMAAAYGAKVAKVPWSDPISGTELRYIVERMCNDPAATPPATEAEIIARCDILPPKVPSAGTDNKCVVRNSCLKLPPIPVFRITVRADILNTNAVSYAQAFVK